MKRNWKYFLSGLAGASMLLGSAHGAIVNVTDADMTGDQHWTSLNTYVLDGFVHVENGESLRIDPGTVVKGKTGTGAAASALIVARGGKIYAEGNPDNPIIFTSELDSTAGETANGLETQLGISAQASDRWGGLVLLGNAVINSAKDSTGNAATPRYEVFEGMNDDTGINSGEFVHRFGGNDDLDSSGALRYVQIRYAGTEFATDAELNGLTLGAVGSGTKLEYIEVFNGSDDGIEWWGGTVNASHLVVAFCQDDSVDFDQGYRGTNQFVFVIQDASADKGAEIDGDLKPGDMNTPETRFQLWNATFVGNVGQKALKIRDQAMPRIYNSVFANYGQFLEYEADNQAAVTAGEVRIQNNILGAVATVTSTKDTPAITGGDLDGTNLNVDAQLIDVEITVNAILDPRPAAGSPALTPGNVKAVPSEGILCPVDYLGAFAPNDLWITRWTTLAAFGFVEGNGTGFTNTGNLVSVADADITGTVNWYRTNTYVLDGFVHVENGEELHIEAGTVIKGKTGTGAAASALIVARGGKIYANGTANNPVIFTTELDETVGLEANAADMFLGVSAQASDRWGGLVILGNAVINSAKDSTGNAASPRYEVFEGMNDDMGINSSEFVHRFGGNDDTDSSGVLSHVQIRYAGTEFATDSELNGLTLGAVGSGTKIEYVEVINGSDDGIEWWGGTVNAKCLVVAYCEDDSVDFDQGYRGTNQFVLVVQGPSADKGAEIDGDLKPGDMNTPETQFYLWNATFLGNNAAKALKIRDQAMPRIYNSVFENYDHFIEYEADNQAAVTAGQVRIHNNILGGVTTVTSTKDTPVITGGDLDGTNLNVDAMLNATTGVIDPRPAAGSPALVAGNLRAFTPDGFLSDPDFLGAFPSDQNWAVDWTALASFGLMSSSGGANPKKLPTLGLVQGPDGATAVTGGSATLSVTVVGGTSLTYVWKKDGVILGSETGNSINIAMVNASTAGSYTVEVTDVAGGFVSKTFSVSAVDIATFAGLVITGKTGDTFDVQYTTDLGNPMWMNIETITLTMDSMIYVDTTASIQDAGKRFYQAVPTAAP